MFPARQAPPVILDQALLEELKQCIKDLLEINHENTADMKGLLMLASETLLLLTTIISKLVGWNSLAGIATNCLTGSLLYLVYFVYSKHYIDPSKNIGVNFEIIKHQLTQDPNKGPETIARIKLLLENEKSIKTVAEINKNVFVPYLHTANFYLSACTFGTKGIIGTSNVAAYYEIKDFVRALRFTQ